MRTRGSSRSTPPRPPKICRACSPSSTGADFPELGTTKIAGRRRRGQLRATSRPTCLARDKVAVPRPRRRRGRGDIAHIAEEALAADQGRIRGAAAGHGSRRAMADDAPLLHDTLVHRQGCRKNRQAEQRRGPHGIRARRHRARLRRGRRGRRSAVPHANRASGLHRAARVRGVDGTKTDRLTIWCCTQGQFNVRAMSPKLLCMTVADIRVIPSEIGGGFGGKITSISNRWRWCCRRRCGRPVKMAMKRDEVFRAPARRPAPTCTRQDRREERRHASPPAKRGSPTRPAVTRARRSAPGAMCVFVLRHPQRLRRRLRRRRQQAEGRGLSRAGRAAGRVRVRRRSIDELAREAEASTRSSSA